MSKEYMSLLSNGEVSINDLPLDIKMDSSFWETYYHSQQSKNFDILSQLKITDNNPLSIVLEIIFNAMEASPSSVFFLNNELKSNKDIVKHVCFKNGELFSNFPSFQNDIEIADIAVSSNGIAYFSLSNELKKNQVLVNKALRTCSFVFRDLEENLKNIEENIIEAIDLDGLLGLVHKKWYSNPNVMLEALKSSYLNIKFLDKDLFKNTMIKKEILINARKITPEMAGWLFEEAEFLQYHCRLKPNAINYINEKVLTKELIKDLINNSTPEIYKYLPEHYKLDREIALTLFNIIDLDRKLLESIPLSLMGNNAFVKDGLKKNAALIKYKDEWSYDKEILYYIEKEMLEDRYFFKMELDFLKEYKKQDTRAENLNLKLNESQSFIVNKRKL